MTSIDLAPAVPDSPILELPPEMRNMIYTFVLQGEDQPYITAASVSEPSLLSACKQVCATVLRMPANLEVLS